MLRSMLFSGLVILSMALFGLAGCGGPSETKSAQGAASRGGAVSPVSKQDRHFVAEAVPAGLAQVELGRLATERANSEEVRAFARRMIDDHSETNERLRAFAQHYAIDAPKRLDDAQAQTKDALRQLDGPAFDRAYMKAQVTHHETTLTVYQRQAELGKAAALQALAQTTAPVLEEHLEEARAIARALTPASNAPGVLQ